MGAIRDVTSSHRRDLSENTRQTPVSNIGVQTYTDKVSCYGGKWFGSRTRQFPHNVFLARNNIPCYKKYWLGWCTKYQYQWEKNNKLKYESFYEVAGGTVYLIYSYNNFCRRLNFITNLWLSIKLWMKIIVLLKVVNCQLLLRRTRSMNVWQRFMFLWFHFKMKLTQFSNSWSRPTYFWKSIVFLSCSYW